MQARILGARRTIWLSAGRTVESTARRHCTSSRAVQVRPVRAARAQDVRELLRESLATPPAEPAAAYRSGAEFLNSQGFDDREEVSRILDIAMNPNSLHRTFRSRKRSAVSVVSIGRMSQPHPLPRTRHCADPPTITEQARMLTVEDDIRPVLEFLASRGLSQRQIVKVCLTDQLDIPTLAFGLLKVFTCTSLLPVPLRSARFKSAEHILPWDN